MTDFQQHLDDFLRYLKFEKRYSVNTLVNYENDLRSLIDFLDHQTPLATIAELQAFHLRTWMAILKNDEGVIESSLNRKRSSVSSFCKFLMIEKVLKSNPAKELKQLKTPGRLPQFLQEKEMKFWLDEKTFTPDYEGLTKRLIVELLYQCGLRRQELISLQDKNVDVDLKYLRIVGKGNKERVMPLAPHLLQVIKEYQELRNEEFPDRQHDFLLTLKNGKPLYAEYVYRFIHADLKDFVTLSQKSPHVLRHTFATQLLNNGANIQAIKELLGHSSLAATQVYTHTTIDQLRDVHKKNHPRG